MSFKFERVPRDEMAFFCDLCNTRHRVEYFSTDARQVYDRWTAAALKSTLWAFREAVTHHEAGLSRDENGNLSDAEMDLSYHIKTLLLFKTAAHVTKKALAEAEALIAEETKPEETGLVIRERRTLGQ